MEGMEKQSAKKPQAEMPKSVDLSGMSPEDLKDIDLSVFFDEETARQMNQVEFEGKEGQRLDVDPKNEESIAKIKGVARMKFEELSRTRGFGKEAQDKLYVEMTRTLKEIENVDELSESFDKKKNAIETSLEEIADQIEIDEAMSATLNS
jgi:hypothetical protein